MILEILARRRKNDASESYIKNVSVKERKHKELFKKHFKVGDKNIFVDVIQVPNMPMHAIISEVSSAITLVTPKFCRALFP